MNPDILRSYLAANEQRHSQLEEVIKEEQSRPAPDSLRLQALKRRKLQMKTLCLHVQRELDVVTGRMATPARAAA